MISTSTNAVVELAKRVPTKVSAVAVFNRGPDSAQVTVDFAKLGIDLRRKTVRDLWAHSNVRVKGTQYVASVPSHGTVLLRVGR